MKKPRYTEQQIAHALRQAEQGTPAVEVYRKLGVSEATFCTWKKRVIWDDGSIRKGPPIREIQDAYLRLRLERFPAYARNSIRLNKSGMSSNGTRAPASHTRNKTFDSTFAAAPVEFGALLASSARSCLPRITRPHRWHKLSITYAKVSNAA